MGLMSFIHAPRQGYPSRVPATMDCIREQPRGIDAATLLGFRVVTGVYANGLKTPMAGTALLGPKKRALRIPDYDGTALAGEFFGIIQRRLGFTRTSILPALSGYSSSLATSV